MSLFLLLVVLLLVLPACSGLRPLAPEVSLVRLEVKEVSLSNATLIASLKVYNPNAIALTIEQIDYHFNLNRIEVAEGHDAPQVRLPAKGEERVELRLRLGYLSLFQLLRNLSPDRSIDYALSGSIRVGGFGILSKTIDIGHKGVIDLDQFDPRGTRPAPESPPAAT